MAYQLPELPYAYNALEASIDAQTMEIHHSKHHNGYVTKLNAAIEGKEVPSTLAELMKEVSKHGTAVRNNGGGHYNHSLFWTILTPNSTKQPAGELAQAINEHFGSFDAFKKQFETAAATQFGSGWAWLSVCKEGKLQVSSTPNQDNPLMDVADVQGTPIFGIDVWEHAYYLKYQNKRPDYLSAIWEIVNWEAVAENYAAAKK